MNPDENNRNPQAPPQNIQPPMQPLNTPQQPQRPVSGAENPYYDQQVQPGQVIGYGLPTDQQVYGVPRPQPPSKVKIAVFMLALIFLLVACIGGAIYGIGKISSEKPGASNAAPTSGDGEQVAVPEDWETIDTELGFSVKTPSGWEKGPSADSTINNMESTSLTLANPPGEDATAEEVQAQQTQILSAATNKLKDGGDQAKFESEITNTSEADKQLAETLGVDTAQVKTTNQKIRINGKDFVRVDTSIPGTQTSTYYHWAGDKAVSVSATQMNDDKTSFEEYVNKYLKPAAASIEVDGSGEA